MHEPLPMVRKAKAATATAAFEVSVTLWDPIVLSKGYCYTFEVDPSVTIQLLKHTLAPMLSYLPEHLDILLSTECPYPLAEKMPLSQLRERNRALLVQPCGPMLNSYEPYVKGEILDLRHMAATDIPLLIFWVRTPSLRALELSADHPRAEEIIKAVQLALLKPHSIETITVSRGFTEAYAKMHPPRMEKEAWEFHGVERVFEPWVIGNAEVVRR